MTAQFDSWDSYFWEPGGPVLRNLYGERDGAILAHKEYGETSKQHALIETGTLPIPRTYDAAHLRLLHYELFKNVFEWAGEYRTVSLFKAPLEFAPPGDIGRYLDDASRIVRGSAWATMDRHQFASTAAEVFAYVNTGGSALLGCELYAYDLPPLDRARNGDRGVRPRRDHRIRGASAKASSSIERSP